MKSMFVFVYRPIASDISSLCFFLSLLLASSHFPAILSIFFEWKSHNNSRQVWKENVHQFTSISMVTARVTKLNEMKTRNLPKKHRIRRCYAKLIRMKVQCNFFHSRFFFFFYMKKFTVIYCHCFVSRRGGVAKRFKRTCCL